MNQSFCSLDCLVHDSAGEPAGRRRYDLIQTALLDHDVLPHDQPVRGHLAQLRQNAVDVFVSIDEGDDDGQLASGFDQMRGVDLAASEKAVYGVEGDGSE